MGLYVMWLKNEISLDVKKPSFFKGQKLGGMLSFGEATERVVHGQAVKSNG